MAATTYSSKLPERLSELRAKVDTRLKEIVGGITEGCPARLRDSIAYSLLAPGKRLRPAICLMAAQAASGKELGFFDESELLPALDAACAIECIHCYSLIHDDLPAMDDDDLRRGRPTNHVQFDEATAVLAGDALQPLAFELLARSIPDPEKSHKSLLALAIASGPANLVGGQMDDLLGGDLPIGSEKPERTREKFLEQIHLRKTAAMISVSAEIGGIVGGGNDSRVANLKQYGEMLGLAFQIVDDILDVESTDEQIGKTAGKDSAANKLTYPALYGLSDSRSKAESLTNNAIDQLTGFGESAQPLIDLANFVVERNH